MKISRNLVLVAVSLSFAVCPSWADFEYNDGAVNTLSDTIDDNVNVTGATTLNITTTTTEGHITGNLTVYDSSIVNLMAGSVDGNVTAKGSSQVTISDGMVGGNVYADETATVSVTGGTFQGDLNTLVSSTATVNVAGGSFQGSLIILGSSTVTYSGGSFAGDIEVGAGSQLTIYGAGFSFASGSVVDQSGFIGAFTLQDGTHLDGFSYIRDLDGTLILTPLEPTPEPASLTLLGIGAASLLGYAWRKRKHGQAAW